MEIEPRDDMIYVCDECADEHHYDDITPYYCDITDLPESHARSECRHCETVGAINVFIKS